MQHLEITRDIAQKFNHLFGEVFTIPKAQVMKSIRVPSLDGSGKMGKSDNNTVSLLDSPETILKKVMSAKTDLGPEKGKETVLLSDFPIFPLPSKLGTRIDFITWALGMVKTSPNRWLNF